jgi:hypothetical protein
MEYSAQSMEYSAQSMGIGNVLTRSTQGGVGGYIYIHIYIYIYIYISAAIWLKEGSQRNGRKHVGSCGAAQPVHVEA